MGKGCDSIMVKLADGRRIFESAGYWYISGSNQMFNTQAEALIMDDKIRIIGEVQNYMGILTGIVSLNAYITANDYGQGAKNAVTDAEAMSVKGNLLATDIFSSMDILSQIEDLLTNKIPTQENYMPVVNLVRAK